MSRGHLNTLTLIPLSRHPYPHTTLIPTLILTLIPTTMALIEEEWAVMASKYGYGINIDKAIKDELIEFIKTIIYLYKTQDLIDNDL